MAESGRRRDDFGLGSAYEEALPNWGGRGLGGGVGLIVWFSARLFEAPCGQFFGTDGDPVGDSEDEDHSEISEEWVGWDPSFGSDEVDEEVDGDQECEDYGSGFDDGWDHGCGFLGWVDLLKSLRAALGVGLLGSRS